MVLDKIFNKPQENVELFWSLVIGRDWVQAGIWRVVGQTTEIISEGVSTSWQEDNIESLVTAADSSLSSAAGNVEEGQEEPNKVVFGLLSSWVEEGSIKKERLGDLKRLSSELELFPAGFVVLPESIVHLIKAREGAPLNAILVGLTNDSVEVNLIQSGKILGTAEVARSVSLGADVAEGLARLPVLTQYPSRILLYDHKAGSLDDARQNIIDADWDELNVSFLHVPKVEILPDDVGVTAVSLAGGAEVGQAKEVVFPAQEEEEIEEDNEAVTTEEYSKEEKNVGEAKDLGFLEGMDIAQKAFPLQPESIGAEVVNTEEPVKDFAPIQQRPSLENKIEEKTKQDRDLVKKSLPRLPIFPLRIPKFSFGKAKGIIVLLFVGLGLILVGGGIVYWYLPKASVVVYVAPKKLEKTIIFTVDPNITVIDKEKKIIPGSIKEAAVSGEKTASTTGSKTVGERARGKVTIFHVGGAMLLKSGTTLSGPGGLKYTLDDNVQVASGSSLANPSKVQALTSAGDIGAQYNLAGSTEFSVGNFSKADFVAQNLDALSGGTSRTVSAVSESDRVDIENELSKELVGKGSSEIDNQLGGKEVLIEDSSSFKAVEKKFSHRVGEESSNLKLSMSGRVAATAISKDDLNSLIFSELEKDVPSGFSLKQDQLEVTFKQQETNEQKDNKKDKKVEEKKNDKTAKTFVAAVRANFLPKVITSDISKEITGKNPQDAKRYLSKIPGYTGAEISFNFILPGKLGTLPRVSKNISVEVSAEK